MYFYGETWFTLQRGMSALHLRRWQAAIDLLTTGLDALPEEFRRDRTWYRACLAHAFASAGEAPQSLTLALTTVPDAASIGRPHSWNELHTTAAVLLRHGAKGRTPTGLRTPRKRSCPIGLPCSPVPL